MNKAKENLALGAYRLLLFLSGPFLLVRLFVRGRKNSAYRDRIAERFGHSLISPQANGIWIHAVSVGEANAALPLLKILRHKLPDKSITLTCTTPTGSQLIQSVIDKLYTRFGEEQRVYHCYLPFDQYASTNRFFDRVKPQIGIIMETELWPNLSHNAYKHDVSLMVANLRLSEKSYSAYQKIRHLMGPVLGCFDSFAVQYQPDADRLKKLGVKDKKIVTTGNIKFDISIDSHSAEQAAKLRKAQGKRLIWVAGSTHDGEDELILDVHQRLLKQNVNLLLIIVPRHPERFDQVAELCSGSQLSLQRFSTTKHLEDRAISTETNVYLADVMGQLSSLLALSDVAFIGGSLVPTGGHNLLEACSASTPVLFGRYMHNFQTISEMVIQADAGIQVDDEYALFDALNLLLNDRLLRKKMGRNGMSLLSQNQGALDQVVNMAASLVRQ